MIEYLGGEGFGAARSSMPLSPAVRAGDYIFVSGQLPTASTGAIVCGNVETQTHVVMKKIEAIFHSFVVILSDIC